MAIASVLDQDLTDFEAWIIGDACTDDSEAIVRSFKDERLHWKNLSVNSGSQAYPNNEGLRLAQGKYIAYLGHDDLWLPGHLSGLVHFSEETGADFVHSLCAMIGPREEMRECIGPPRARATYRDAFIPPSCWVHRRDILKSCGLWANPDQIPSGVDFEYQRRIFAAGTNMKFYPRLTVLKFPSLSFPNVYATLDHSIQLRYRQQLKEDAAAVEHEVLLEQAIAYARERHGGDPPPGEALASFAYIVLRRLRDFGIDRWPLSALLRWRWQRKRAAARQWRGLPPRAPYRH